MPTPTVRISTTQGKDLSTVAKRLGMSQSEVIRQALILAGYIKFEVKPVGAKRGTPFQKKE